MSDNGLEAQQIRKKTLPRNKKRKQRLATSADERSTELSKQRKGMRLLRDRERLLDGLLGWRLCIYVVMKEHKRSLPNPGKKFQLSKRT